MPLKASLYCALYIAYLHRSQRGFCISVTLAPLHDPEWVHCVLTQLCSEFCYIRGELEGESGEDDIFTDDFITDVDVVAAQSHDGCGVIGAVHVSHGIPERTRYIMRTAEPSYTF